jgi:Malectin domain
MKLIKKPFIQHIGSCVSMFALIFAMQASEVHAANVAVRVAAGGAAYKDHNGNSWLADQYFNGGNISTIRVPIANTLNAALYQSERWGSTFSYRIPVLNGTYKIMMGFSENYFNNRGDRIFNVTAEGNAVLSNFDIIASAGSTRKAVRRVFTGITVSDGFLDIYFSGVKGNAKVDIIEIISNKINISVQNPVRIAAGRIAYKDHNGNSWLADQYFSGGSTFTIRDPITNTVNSALYQSERWGSAFGYRIPVRNGIYKLTLGFSENYFKNRGDRIFNVTAEDAPIISNFDIFESAGGVKKAVDKVFQKITVNDGFLDIDFAGVRNNAKVDFIEVVSNSSNDYTPIPTAQEPFKIGIIAGGTVYESATGMHWSGDHYYTGGNTFASFAPISGTDLDPLYQSERFGKTFSYRVPVPNGTYVLTLRFAENYFNSPGQRSFNVIAEGQQLLTNFDIVATSGGKQKAIDKIFQNITISDGFLDLAFIGVYNDAKVSSFDLTGGPLQPVPTASQWSRYLTPYLDHPTAKTKTVQQIFDATKVSNAQLPQGYEDLRKSIITMYKNSGFDISLSGSALASFRPWDYSGKSPQPLSGSYTQPLSEDAPYYQKIPENSPRVALPDGYFSTFQFNTMSSNTCARCDGIGIGFTAPVNATARLQTIHTNSYPYTTWTMNIMPNALNYLPKPGNYDGHQIFIDGANNTSLSCYHTTAGSNSDYECLYAPAPVRLPFLGDYGGTNAPQISEFGYVLRPGEATNPEKPIPHALGGPVRKIWPAIVYPAVSTDSDAFSNANAIGLVPYGGMVQIDPSINIRQQFPGLTLPAYRILEALQQYGWIMLDGGAYQDINIHTNTDQSEYAPYGGLDRTLDQVGSVIKKVKWYIVPPQVKKK